MNEKATPLASDDDAWEPGGALGNDERYAVALNDPETERAIDRALGLQIRLRRWLRKRLCKK